MLYKVFVDDSGKKEYFNPYSREFIDNPPLFEDYQQFWRDNYFVLCAVRVSQKHIAQINIAVNSLKQQYFKTNKVEIKSDWLRNPKQRQKYYFSVYNINDIKLLEFIGKIYDLIRFYRKELKLIAVVFDKRFYGDAKRRTTEGMPLVKCAQVLFERLQYLNAYHIVIFDQFEDHLKVDKGHHEKILNITLTGEGFEKIYVNEFDKIIDIKFSKSRSENFIQMADLCAYNIFRQFVHYGRQWQIQEAKDMLVYPYFHKIRCNFQAHPLTGKVAGVGLTCLPDIAKCNWNLLDGCDE